MTLREAIRRLADAGVQDAKNDALLLWTQLSGESLASVMFALDTDISGEPCYAEFMSLLSRREAREPLQYILGKWSFYGDEYTVTPACLIPRADTEILVEALLDVLKPNAKIADLCCGSGCIGIAAVKNSDASCVSVDISEAALAVARENARALGVCGRVRFDVCDVTDKASVASVFGGEAFDIIASNPPYIKPSDAHTLAPELSYEPSLALFGGEDGMHFYRKITENFASRLAPDGVIIYEIGYDEADDIQKIARDGGFSCRTVNDLEGRARVAILKKDR